MRITALIFISFCLACTSQEHMADAYEVRGYDISHHQRLIDWDSFASAKPDFVFIKASEGHDLIDSLFCYNWGQAKRHQIRRGFYHFYRPGLEQTSVVKELVDLEPGDLPPVLDVEKRGTESDSEFIKNIQQWLLVIEGHYKIRPIIYTNSKFYRRHLKGHFDDHLLWIARYNRLEPVLEQGQWSFWQYSDQGLVKGVSKPIDQNVFRGSIQDLDALCHTTKSVP